MIQRTDPASGNCVSTPRDSSPEQNLYRVSLNLSNISVNLSKQTEFMNAIIAGELSFTAAGRSFDKKSIQHPAAQKQNITLQRIYLGTFTFIAS